MKQTKAAARSYWKPATLVLALLMLSLSAVGLLYVLPPPPPVTVNGPGYPHKPSLDTRLAWYFQTGQWRADARTLAALVRYLVSPEPTPLGSQPPVPA